jgi:protocatechuate 3,4-dioxygenase beta subunit
MRPLIVLLFVLIAAVVMILALQDDPTSKSTGVTPELSGKALPEGDSRVETIRTPENPGREANDFVENPSIDPAPPVTASNSLVGRVLNDELAPLVGAKVLLSRDAMMGDDLAMNMILGVQPKGKPIEATTNAKGEYLFKKIEPARDYYILAKHPEYAEVQEQLVVVGQEGEFKGPDIILRPGAVVYGTVGDVGGGAVPRALLQLDSAFFTGQGDSPGRRQVTADNNGYFEFKNVSPGPRIMTVIAEGYGTQTKNNIPVGNTPGERIEVSMELDAGQPIAGIVTSEGGLGVPNVLVQAYNYESNISYRGSATTDENGLFQIDDLHPSGSYILQAEAMGYRQEKQTRVRFGEMTVEIAMIKQACVTGRVLAVDGSPVRSFEASLRRVSEPRPNGEVYYEDIGVHVNFTSQADGEYELCGLNPGTFVVVARAPNYAPTPSEVIKVVEGQSNTQVDIRMNMGGTITGSVVGPDGLPVAGAQVSTHDDSFEDALDSFFENLVPTNVTERKTRTNSEGKFVLKLLTPETYQVRVAHHNFTDKSLHGTVYNQSGAAAARAFVHLESYDGQKTYTDRADDKGNYRFENVRPGQYTLSATGVSPNGPDAINAIIDQRNSQVTVNVADGREIPRDLHIGG